MRVGVGVRQYVSVCELLRARACMGEVFCSVSMFFSDLFERFMLLKLAWQRF